MLDLGAYRDGQPLHLWSRETRKMIMGQKGSREAEEAPRAYYLQEDTHGAPQQSIDDQLVTNGGALSNNAAFVKVVLDAAGTSMVAGGIFCITRDIEYAMLSIFVALVAKGVVEQQDPKSAPAFTLFPVGTKLKFWPDRHKVSHSE